MECEYTPTCGAGFIISVVVTIDYVHTQLGAWFFVLMCFYCGFSLLPPSLSPSLPLSLPPSLPPSPPPSLSPSSLPVEINVTWTYGEVVIVPDSPVCSLWDPRRPAALLYSSSCINILYLSLTLRLNTHSRKCSSSVATITTLTGSSGGCGQWVWSSGGCIRMSLLYLCVCVTSP